MLLHFFLAEPNQTEVCWSFCFCCWIEVAIDYEDHEDCTYCKILWSLSVPKEKILVDSTSWSAAKWKTELSWMNKLSEAARGAVLLPLYQSWRERFIGSGQRSLLSLYLPSDSKGYCGKKRLRISELYFMPCNLTFFAMRWENVKFDKVKTQKPMMQKLETLQIKIIWPKNIL